MISSESMAADPPRQRTATWPTTVGRPPANPVEHLWHELGAEKAQTERRFDQLERQVESVQEGVTAIAGAVTKLTLSEATRAEAETRAARSVELRNTRMWQVATPVIAALALAVIVAIFKVFVPLAMGHQVNPTINEMIDEGQFDSTRQQRGGK